MLTHNDYWSGNTLWDDGRMTGVVDWSGAVVAPRGRDVSWARQDLILSHGSDVADTFTRAYQEASGEVVPRLAEWDLYAALRAEPYVETWAPNYQSLGRTEMTPAALRAALNEWLPIARERMTSA